MLADQPRWKIVLEKLTAKEMPPEEAKNKPSDEARQQVIDWIAAMRADQLRKTAGDPGVVLARRLSNAEYNYTIRDLTGVDMRPAREFPVDPTNPAGFDNSGESLAMSPALLTKYLKAAREVADHLVFKPNGLAFAPYPMLVETDRDKYCVQQIVDFYHRQDTDYAHYFLAAWRYKNRAALGEPTATLEMVAAEAKVSSKYLSKIWLILEDTKEKIGPLARLQDMWGALPQATSAQQSAAVDQARAGCEQMRDFVVGLRKKVEPRFPNIVAGKFGATSQPLLMWKNRQYASHRMTFDRDALQVGGEPEKVAKIDDPTVEPGAENEFGPGHTQPVKNGRGDPDLAVPAGKRAEFEAAFAKFCEVFPDAFYVEERGRNYFDKTKDRGRLLSAGFHNVMGYFRDDQPLYQLVLDEKQQHQLDEMWRELDYVASACSRTYVQFCLNEASRALNLDKADKPEAGKLAANETSAAEKADGDNSIKEPPADDDKGLTSEARIMRLKQVYLERAAGNEIATQAVEDHFKMVNDTLRWVEQTKLEAEPIHLNALLEFAARAYRRPLTQPERDDLLAFYHTRRDKDGADHESALRDCFVSVLLSPDFCYRIDLVGDGYGAGPLSDYALASRLSYFLWASMPDDELLAHAAAGDLHQPATLVAQARRMLKDSRVRGLATEFGANWLDFRRFEELNTVDRERFGTFTDELREAMFEEPIRFMLDVFQKNRSVLDFLYANDTFVNPILAIHYGMPPLDAGADEWVRVEDAEQLRSRRHFTDGRVSHEKRPWPADQPRQARLLGRARSARRTHSAPARGRAGAAARRSQARFAASRQAGCAPGRPELRRLPLALRCDGIGV